MTTPARPRASTRVAALSSGVRLSVLFAILLAMPPLATRAALQAQVADEAEVKAAFLYHFALFVEWPRQRSARPFVIGVVGDEPVATALEHHLRRKTIRGREGVVLRLAPGEDVSKLDILFIGSREDRQVASLLRQAGDAPVLSVGETDLFAEQGGIVRLLSVDKRMRFRINARAAEQAGLRVPAALLSLSVK